MKDISVGHIEAEPTLAPVFSAFTEYNPGFRLGWGIFDGAEGMLASEHGGVRHIWLDRGQGEVFLTEGYRTKEGDGESLVDEYHPDPLPGHVQEALSFLLGNLNSLSRGSRNVVEAILQRYRGQALVGDFANEIWQLTHVSHWAEDAELKGALDLLAARYRDLGWQTKGSDSWEPIHAGDQLITTPEGPARTRGEFRYWWIEDLERDTTPISATRRLPYLKETSGGCNFDFDAFRKTPHTWYLSRDRSDADGDNRLNSHVVNIPEETSPTHYHPVEPIGGGKAQVELYLVLDPVAQGLDTHGREPLVVTFPDLEDLTRFDKTPLMPGSIVLIPPGVAHRGLNVFVNVVTLPGFKPDNELYIDGRIRDIAGDRAPYCEGAVHKTTLRRDYSSASFT